VGAASALVMVACGPVKDPQSLERRTVVELPATPNRDLDLLFVIDDSPSMLDKQVNLTTNFPSFLDRLQGVLGGLPNLHVGVVTTDMGTKASGSAMPGPNIGLIGQGGCSGTGKGGALQTGMATGLTEKYLIDVEAPGGTRTRNYTGTLAATFSAMAKLGAGGCGFEQPLAAMRAALDNHPANVGFLRPEAMLGVVFLSDEDDCSAKSTQLFGPDSPTLGPLQSFRCMRFGVTCAEGGTTSDAMNEAGPKAGCAPAVGSSLLDDVAPYRDFLRGLKRDPRRIAVTGIIGPTEPVEVELRPSQNGGAQIPALVHSCSYTGPTGVEVADPAVRLQDLITGFPDRSAFTPVCDRDLSNGLTQLAELFRRAIGSPCIQETLADAKSKTGLQADCVVEDLIGPNAIEIKACDADLSARPCWRLESDAADCSTAFLNLKLVVQREVPPDPTTVTRMRCVVEPPP